MVRAKLPGRWTVANRFSFPGSFCALSGSGFLGVCYPLVNNEVPSTTVLGHVMNTGEYLWYVHALVDPRPNPRERGARRSISRSFPVEEREKAGLKDVSLSNQRRFKDVRECP